MVKKTTIIYLAITLILSVTSLSNADIRDNPGYVPSTGLSIGGWTTIHSGDPDYELSGYAITEAFQINLEYQDGILDSDIDAFNAYDPDGNWDLNFTDYDEYVLNINVGGGLTIYEYEGMAETYNPDIEWTLTGWHQTILAGEIVGNSLVVVPTGTYRPFVGDPPVNNVEIFDGDLNCEVLAYTFTGLPGDIGSGDVLGVTLVPIPGAVLLGILGLSAAGIKLRKFA